MDIDTIDPVSLDVSNSIEKLYFRFYSETEALRLSVRRLTSPHAFDELGRPVARGLYDAALGPTHYSDGPCATCGLNYNNCPGHFGHIELPFPVQNPLLLKVIWRILRASCWHCNSLKLPDSDVNLYLARLYFEDADNPEAARAVEAYRTLRRRVELPTGTSSNPDKPKKSQVKYQLIKNWREFLDTLPHPIPRYMEGIDVHDDDLVSYKMMRSARNDWKHALCDRRIVARPSAGWKEAESQLFQSGGLNCSRCLRKCSKLRRGDRGRIFKASAGGDLVLSPPEIEAHVKALWANHEELFELLYGLKGRGRIPYDEHPGHKVLFVRIVLVPPSRFRPTSLVGNMTYAAEHPQNMFYQRLLTEIGVIMTANEYGLKDSKERDVSEEDIPNVKLPTKARFAQAMTNTQEALRDLYDSSGMAARSGSVQMTGIRQQLEAKAGLFRQHMMGKRVNYSCRSVIGPDVFLDTNEVGIPESFARLLTVPEPVTASNLKEMRRAVINGPDVYPGAVAVEDWNHGRRHRIVKFRSSKMKKLLLSQAGLLVQNRSRGDDDQHQSHEFARLEDLPDDTMGPTGDIPKRVHRHLKTGDIVLFNRQPTLHRVSIMAHRVRVLPGDRTIRFHYANCGSYNADFDGDEMNIHVPQDPIARAEAEELMLSSNHYVVPTSGVPIRGLIQDHIVASTLLSTRDRFFDRAGFMQLLFASTEKIMLRPKMAVKRYYIPKPAILKPKPLWTGKQLFSAVLRVIQDDRPGLYLEGKSKTAAMMVGLEEAHILLRNGELLQGCIDKSSLGASKYGLIHAVQELYGCEASNDFMNAVSRLCLFFLRSHGHTTGIEDLLLRESGEKERRAILQSSIDQVGIDVTNEVYALLNRSRMLQIRKATTIQEARQMVEEMVKKDGVEAESRLDKAMKTTLGTVSSKIMNACMPFGLQKAFPSNGFSLMTSTGAKGGALNAAQISCLLGSTELEGKRVPRMGGSGATLPCFQPYDASPAAGGFITGRFLTGIAPHEFFFHAMSGREGLLDTSLKTANSGYLQRCLVKHMEGVRLHYDGSVRDSDNEVLQFIYGEDGIDPSKATWLYEKTDWQLANRKCLAARLAKRSSRALNPKHTARRPRNVTVKTTLLEEASPGALNKEGKISEKFDKAITTAVKSHSKKGLLRSFLESRYQLAAAQAGDAVGILAAQGVGEPSTQMTLNTFHHAGSSSAHVTLGIPRLRELLMTASRYPNTPSMNLPVSGDQKEMAASALRKRLQNVNLLDLVLEVEVHEKSITFLPGQSECPARRVELKIRFPPQSDYRSHLGFGFKHVKGVVEKRLLLALHNGFKRVLGMIGAESIGSVAPALKSYNRVARKPESNFPGGGDDMDQNGDPALGVNDEYRAGNGDETEDRGDVEGDEDIHDDGDNQDKIKEEHASGEASEHYASSSDEEEEDENGEEANEKVLDSVKLKEHDNVMDAEVGSLENETREETIASSAKKDSGLSTQVKEEKGAMLATEGEEEFLDIGYGSFGYVDGSLRDVNEETVEFEWSFPAAVIGKLSVSEIVKKAASTVKLAYSKRIDKCFVGDVDGGLCVITEGSNLPLIFEKGEGLVDLDRLETNDMFGILQTYGVEAMRAALIKEFTKVFEAYGIPVNIRHLALIADYMTAHGSYRGFNRQGMDDTPSVFQRMTFETSVKFLTDAALHGTNDDVRNPSTALSLGREYRGGTGAFTLMHDMPSELHLGHLYR